MARNPYFQPGPPALPESVIQHVRLILVTFLQANANRSVIPDAELQALHPLLAPGALFQRFHDELGL